MWNAYLQLRGAEARANGQARGDHQLNGQDATKWLQGYDAMDGRIAELLNEIRAGWLSRPQEEGCDDNLSGVRGRQPAGHSPVPELPARVLAS